MPLYRLFLPLAALGLSACAMALSSDPQVPDGYTRAEYVPDNPAPVLPPGVTRADILWRHGCYYILQDGHPVRLPFTETNPETGQVSEYDFYCIG